MRIGLIGWGTMGSALGDLLSTGPLPIVLTRVAVRDSARLRGSTAKERPHDIRKIESHLSEIAAA